MNASATIHSYVNLSSTSSKGIYQRVSPFLKAKTRELNAMIFQNESEPIFKGKKQRTKRYDLSKWMLSASVFLLVTLPWDNGDSLDTTAVKQHKLCILACVDITWWFKWIMMSNFMTKQKKYEDIRNCPLLHIAGHWNLHSLIHTCICI